MGDIFCRVCGEPYDSYGVQTSGKGDMTAWEAKLFLKGLGCPYCEGIAKDSEDNEEKGLSSLLENGYDDFGHFDAMMDSIISVKGKWERPEPKVVWTCESCGVNIVESVEQEGKYYYSGGEPIHYYRGIACPASSNCFYDDMEDPINFKDEKGNFEVNKVAGMNVCEKCSTVCDDCGKVIFSGSASELHCDDTYDEGNNFYLQEFNKTLCVDCFSNYINCTECGCLFHIEELEDGLCEDCYFEANNEDVEDEE